ncbi:substrate-binding domain-containing protein [Dendrosporobacter sp. 1207_IL3150]|uniref:substrate-binding domain-containing protein n=1 Tax=Dendrosporobacter sp. 1207_IL3150 TaxID=3084054 RepID=UPI002FDB233B
MRKLCSLVLMLMLIVFSGCAMSTSQQGKTNPPAPANKDIILATTTSTQDSGLLDVLLPVFESKTGYKIKTIAVGTGQALAMGEKGEADILLVHAPDAEKKVVAAGSAVNRKLVMHNDFILVGPPNDAALIKGKNVTEALTALAKIQASFISRGDDSGTHKMEKSLWKRINITPASPWYKEAGAGMGQTLKIADEKQAYTLSDRATYLAQKKNLSLEVLVEGDAKLLNIYHVMEVNPAKFSKANNAGAKAFIDFLLSAEGQSLISTFGKDKFGQPLFFADGGKTEKDIGL